MFWVSLLNIIDIRDWFILVCIKSSQDGESLTRRGATASSDPPQHKTPQRKPAAEVLFHTLILSSLPMAPNTLYIYIYIYIYIYLNIILRVCLAPLATRIICMYEKDSAAGFPWGVLCYGGWFSLGCFVLWRKHRPSINPLFGQPILNELVCKFPLVENSVPLSLLIRVYVYIERMHWHIIYDYYFNKVCFILSPLYFHFTYRRAPMIRYAIVFIKWFVQKYIYASSSFLVV